jgi:2-polyprenyl-3-methyl-5-hydroxy-6-metoxy-1,4-benzoquinol methylase
LSLLKEVSKKDSIADIGSGSGDLAKVIKEKFNPKEIVCVDNSFKNLRKVKKSGLKAVYSDVSKKINLKSSYFDVVICNQVLEHLINPDKCLIEINRILKDGGILLISVPNLCSFHNRILVLFGKQPTTIPPSNLLNFGVPFFREKMFFEGGRHLNGFSPAALKEMLYFYGFKIEKVRGNGFYPLPSLISKTFSNLFPSFSVYLIVRAKKIKSFKMPSSI